MMRPIETEWEYGPRATTAYGICHGVRVCSLQLTHKGQDQPSFCTHRHPMSLLVRKRKLNPFALCGAIKGSAILSLGLNFVGLFNLIGDSISSLSLLNPSLSRAHILWHWERKEQNKRLTSLQCIRYGGLTSSSGFLMSHCFRSSSFCHCLTLSSWISIVSVCVRVSRWDLGLSLWQGH